MNKITVTIIIILIAILALLLWRNDVQKKRVPGVTPTQALENSIKADTISDIDAKLDEIDINNGTDEDLKNIDADLQNI
jgi:hypothetical protein